MNSTFDPRQISPDQYRERIRALEERLAEEQAALRKTEAELNWWRQGMDLFIGTVAGGRPAPTSSGDKPVLRNAILKVITEGDETVWRAPDVIQELTLRGWMPNGKNADHIVRSRLSKLTTDGDLERVGYGLYALPGTGEDAVK